MNDQDQIWKAAAAQLRQAPKLKPRPDEELLHELQVHQIELGMQNEELRRVQVALEESRDRYVDLYDFAPVGYLSLNREGMIAEINLTGAALLGVERNKLPHHRFAPFVATEDRDRWHRHFLSVLTRDDAQICELALQKGDGSRLYARLDCLRLSKTGKTPVVRIVLTDITGRKAIEEQTQQYVAQIESAFMRTVEVTTTLTEMRDPYTAAHERRVAEIAAAIGSELGLNTRRVEGLRVAGLLHDIGKISLPAEILAKPCRITAAEYTLVKEHAQSGYDALKDVGFPWPVAEVAWQHHERMDGSGYPRGLKGDEILLEARIMSVADVVEAMASHRPYRPGHGINKALEEIERGSGSAYDTAVVAACLRLFREQGYALPV